MRSFDYRKYKNNRWDNEITNYLSLIHEYKGKQDLYLRQKPVELEKLLDRRRLEHSCGRFVFYCCFVFIFTSFQHSSHR